MIRLSLATAAAVTAGELRLPDTKPGERLLRGLATDSRKPLAGNLFVALRGERFDGHDFVAAAQRQGACAALVEQWQASDLAQIRVPDTVTALGQLAAHWRQRFNKPLIALTGSNGKTTVKEMIAAVLRQRGNVLATRGNLNNAIGVPLTLAELGEHDYAVIEMGANRHGEIAYLTELAQPDVGLITNAGPAHLQGFGDLAGVARGKGELWQKLPPAGIAVLNHDDAYFGYWRGLLKSGERRLIEFGLSEQAQVYGVIENSAAGQFRLHIKEHTTGDGVAIRLPLPGRHAIYNALAAAAATWAVGVDSEQIRQGLETMQAVAGRLQSLPGPYGSTLLNDAYNANPASLQAGLQVVSAMAAPKWLVLGDMAELGDAGVVLHRQAGEQARRHGIERLFAIGDYSRHCSSAFGSAGQHFTTVAELSAALLDALRQGAPQCAPVILIKGSRSMAMERVVTALAAHRESRE